MKGCHDHLCQAQPGIVNTLVTQRKIKSAALSNILTSTAEITEGVLAENVNNELTPSLPAHIY